MDQQLTKQERRRLKREEKKAAKAGERQKKAMKKNLVRGVFILAGIVLIGGLIMLSRANQPATEDFSVEFASQGGAHIPVGSDHPEYNSNPPTSGWHYDNWIRESILREEAPDGFLIHNLEHGQVWISYHPERVSEAVIEQLESFAGSWVVISPRSANDTDIAVAAWTRLDKFDIEGEALTDDQMRRIQDFITRYRNRSPESIPIGTGM